MWLFGKKKVVKTEPKKLEMLPTRSFLQTDSFRGMKRINVSVFGHKPSEKGNKDFLQDNKPVEKIEFVCCELPFVGFPYGYIVYVNGHRCGTIMDPDYAKALANNEIEAVHVHFDERIRLFMKWREPK